MNVEGGWKITTTPNLGLVQMTPAQDGRSFADPAKGVKNGRVNGKHVSFDVDDSRYEGFFGNDRDHLYGVVWETMGFSQIGAWSAVRSGKP